MPHKTPASRRAYYLAHKEQEAAAHRIWALANKEALTAYDRAYKAAHKEELLAYSRAYHVAHKEERAAYDRAYNAAHRTELTAKQRAKRQMHPELTHASNKKYSARKNGAPLNDLTHAQWLEIQAAQDHCCYYCRKHCKGHLTQDHIQPLSKGGSHTLHNVIGACRSCNSRKHTSAPPIPVQPLLLTIARAAKKQ